MKKYTLYKLVIIILLSAILYTLYTLRNTSYKTSVTSSQINMPVKHIVRRPINIPTRGIEDYRQLGILSDAGGNVLPLYGRRTYSGSTKWNYFTRANDHLSLKIPLSSNGNSCDDHIGCPELYDDDSINIPEYNGNFNVKFYNNTPRYIPF
jgi:hypothetical protein